MEESLIQLTDSFREQVIGLKRQLEMLEAGKFSTGNQLPGRLIDTTEESKIQLRNIINELERLIAEYDPRLR